MGNVELAKALKAREERIQKQRNAISEAKSTRDYSKIDGFSDKQKEVFKKLEPYTSGTPIKDGEFAKLNNTNANFDSAWFTRSDAWLWKKTKDMGSKEARDQAQSIDGKSTQQFVQLNPKYKSQYDSLINHEIWHKLQSEVTAEEQKKMKQMFKNEVKAGATNKEYRYTNSNEYFAVGMQDSLDRYRDGKKGETERDKMFDWIRDRMIQTVGLQKYQNMLKEYYKKGEFEDTGKVNTWWGQTNQSAPLKWEENKKLAEILSKIKK